MTTIALSNNPEDWQRPEDFLRSLYTYLGATSDVQLSYVLGLPKSMISKIRSGRVEVSGSHLLKIHFNTAIPISQLMEMLYLRPFPPPTAPPKRALELYQDAFKVKVNKSKFTNPKPRTKDTKPTKPKVTMATLPSTVHRIEDDN